MNGAYHGFYNFSEYLDRKQMKLKKYEEVVIPGVDGGESQTLGQLKNLVMLASADERFTDSELAVLLAVASRENITPEEFNNVIDNPDSVKITLPEDEDTKLAFLRDMVAMMMVDGELDEQELAICKIYAMALGYHGSIVDGMIAGVIDSLDAGTDQNDE